MLRYFELLIDAICCWAARLQAAGAFLAEIYDAFKDQGVDDALDKARKALEKEIADIRERMREIDRELKLAQGEVEARGADAFEAGYWADQHLKRVADLRKKCRERGKFSDMPAVEALFNAPARVREEAARRLIENLRLRSRKVRERPFNDMRRRGCLELLAEYLGELKKGTTGKRIGEILLKLWQCLDVYKQWVGLLQAMLDDLAQGKQTLNDRGHPTDEFDDDESELRALRDLVKRLLEPEKGPCEERVSAARVLFERFRELMVEYQRTGTGKAELVETARLGMQILGRGASDPSALRTHNGLPLWVYWAFLPCCPTHLNLARETAQFDPPDLWDFDDDAPVSYFHSPSAVK